VDRRRPRLVLFSPCLLFRCSSSDPDDDVEDEVDEEVVEDEVDEEDDDVEETRTRSSGKRPLGGGRWRGPVLGVGLVAATAAGLAKAARVMRRKPAAAPLTNDDPPTLALGVLDPPWAPEPASPPSPIIPATDPGPGVDANPDPPDPPPPPGAAMCSSEERLEMRSRGRSDVAATATPIAVDERARCCSCSSDEADWWARVGGFCSEASCTSAKDNSVPSDAGSWVRG
jgi:hypothetical protein